MKELTANRDIGIYYQCPPVKPYCSWASFTHGLCFITIDEPVPEQLAEHLHLDDGPLVAGIH